MDTNTPASSQNLFKDLKSTAAAQPADTVPVTTAAGPLVEPVAATTAAPTTIVAEEQGPSELDMLKNRARIMGIQFSNNIGVDALKAKIDAKLTGEEQQNQAQENQGQQIVSGAVTSHINVAPLVQAVVVETPAQKAQRERDEMRKDQLRLVRLRITNLNPAKKDLPGEIITFANRVLGKVSKFIPFGEQTENGYHVPYCLYTILKDRQFQSIKIRKDSRGREIIETGMVREFALEVLEPLTEIELARLAAAQAAAGGAD